MIISGELWLSLEAALQTSSDVCLSSDNDGHPEMVLVLSAFDQSESSYTNAATALGRGLVCMGATGTEKQSLLQQIGEHV